MGNENSLVVIDNCTKFVELFPSKIADAESTTKCRVILFAPYGRISRMYSDRDIVCPFCHCFAPSVMLFGEFSRRLKRVLIEEEKGADIKKFNGGKSKLDFRWRFTQKLFANIDGLKICGLGKKLNRDASSFDHSRVLKDLTRCPLQVKMRFSRSKGIVL
jgi:hypothetical protein